ncbi:hypothetical protein [Fusobacterium sp. IOR10]|uniref:hypothetical protein n=1 Tax=Fusobacterium sp. IOR10 TaxID=2665157 RepID=UPI0013D17C26|nr:hypothetical protein [Fusobacterium sp. IOR10]
MEMKDFLVKVKENEAKKLKLIQIDIKNYGYLEFMKPKTEDLFKYLEIVANSNEIIDGKDIEEPKDGKTEEPKDKNKEKEAQKIDIKNLSHVIKASSELMYNCSSFLKSKELRNIYPGIHNFDIPTEIFGWDQVIDIASQIMEKFGGSKEISKTKKILDDEIKN